MIEAYLFINLSTEQENDAILEEIRAIPEIQFAYQLYGTYDLVIFIRAKSTVHLKQITLESVRRLQYVESTMTMLALDSYFKN